MNSLTRSAIISLAVFTLAGCAENAATKLQVDRVSSNLGDIRALQANQTTQIASLEAQLRQVTGRLEELEHSQNTRLSADVSDLKNDLSKLQQRVPPPAIVPAAALDEDEGKLVDYSEDVARPFGDALKALRAGKFADALMFLREAQDMTRGKEPAPLIGFWIGVANDAIGDNRAALSAYHEVVSRNAKHRRAPLALLRQGSVLVRLGDPKTAALTFKKIIAEFPKSAEAERAKERLKDLA